MQTTTAAQTKPRPLIFAHHLIGMGIVALANPRIYSSDAPLRAWLETWLIPIAFALVGFGLYALFFTKRAKQAWPKSFFILAWVLLALLSPWVSTHRSNANAAQDQAPAQAPANAKQSKALQVNTTSKRDKAVLSPSPSCLAAEPTGICGPLGRLSKCLSDNLL